MSLDINQIALHQLIKRDEQNLELVLRDSLLEIKLTACLAKRVNWRRRCAYSVRAKRTFWHLAARQPGACVTN